MQLLLKNGEVRGSTGTLRLLDGYLTYTRSGEDTPLTRISIRYEKGQKP